MKIVSHVHNPYSTSVKYSGIAPSKHSEVHFYIDRIISVTLVPFTFSNVNQT